MIDKLMEEKVDEIIFGHYSENKISPEFIEKLEFRDSMISKVSNKEIKCYVKK